MTESRPMPRTHLHTVLRNTNDRDESYEFVFATIEDADVFGKTMCEARAVLTYTISYCARPYEACKYATINARIA